MPLFRTCVVCKQEKDVKKYKRVTPESKRKEGIFKLEVGDLTCSDCYNWKDLETFELYNNNNKYFIFY